jgi:UDPglucose--hexose-1-phosphate uridylyltransferase
VTRSTRWLLSGRPHRRFNSLTGDWVLVSPNRTERPWLGRAEAPAPALVPRHDPSCYLCPGNSRAGGQGNPRYTSTFVFDNDFPALLGAGPGDTAGALQPGSPHRAELLQAEPGAGTCRVICYSPRHDLTLAQMSVPEIGAVIGTWTQQSQELGTRWRWVQIFENKGELMGCSNPHPHGQIWAGDFLPTHAAQELAQQSLWQRNHGSVLLRDYAALESSEGERVIAQDEHWLALVPWWAVWPFEMLLLPRRHVREFTGLNAAERDSLAAMLKQLLSAYDRLFEVSFPYSFGWHSAPAGSAPQTDGWQLHAHFYPPLLRSASVRKFMVGYELLAEPQRDLTPEQAADRLRGCMTR